MKGIFLDIEATGLDPLQHDPIDLAFKVIDLSSGEIQGTFQSIIKQTWEAWTKSDPASIQINGYQWSDIERGKEAASIAEEVIKLLNSLGIARGKSVFVCQNPAFDRAFFTKIVPVYTQEKFKWPYHWLDLASMYWAVHILKLAEEGRPIPEKINLSKNHIAREFNLPPETEPHKAMNGVEHLILCYKAVTHAKWLY